MMKKQVKYKMDTKNTTYSRKKRTKTIILTPKALVILQKHKKLYGKLFDFSYWISNKIETELNTLDMTEVLQLELDYLKNKQLKADQHYENEISKIRNELTKLKITKEIAKTED
jgi:hypothetical protein